MQSATYQSVQLDGGIKVVVSGYVVYSEPLSRFTVGILIFQVEEGKIIVASCLVKIYT